MHNKFFTCVKKARHKSGNTNLLYLIGCCLYRFAVSMNRAMRISFFISHITHLHGRLTHTIISSHNIHSTTTNNDLSLFFKASDSMTFFSLYLSLDNNSFLYPPFYCCFLHISDSCLTCINDLEACGN